MSLDRKTLEMEPASLDREGLFAKAQELGVTVSSKIKKEDTIRLKILEAVFPKEKDTVKVKFLESPTGILNLAYSAGQEGLISENQVDLLEDLGMIKRLK